MIIVKLQGGLGNQMFQYAAAASLASKKHTELAINKEWFKQKFEKQYTPRKYELGAYKLDDQVKNRKNMSWLKARMLYKSYTDGAFLYDKNFFRLPKNTILEGYFQSEKYFLDIRKKLLQDFNYKHKATQETEEVIKKLKNCESVSIHIRRGDYVTNKNANQFHGLLGKEYYAKAIKIINKKVSKPNFFVFSDDIAWAKVNIRTNSPIRFIDFTSSGIEDMRLMRQCKHNIIANSSFSWWGAWLGGAETKTVVAPKNWFKSKDLDTSDVLPERWLKI